MASLQEKKSDLEDALTTRDQALVVESEKQQAHEYLRVEFAEQANQFAEWCTQHIRALDDEMTLEGDLEEHLATIDETLASVHQYGEVLYTMNHTQTHTHTLTHGQYCCVRCCLGVHCVSAKGQSANG